MLRELTIKEFALIDELRLSFAPGLNVLTGETGAGKSIILDAVGVVLGQRAQQEQIRAGREAAFVEAVFDVDELSELRRELAELGIPLDDESPLVIQREIHAEGRNTCRINGRTVTVAAVRQLARHLLDLHGQNEHQTLLEEQTQRRLLDLFGGEVIQGALDRYRRLYEEYGAIQKALREVAGDSRDRARQLDMLRFQADEIGRANLTEDEEEQLERRRRMLMNAEQLFSRAGAAYEALYGEEGPSSVELLGTVTSQLEALLPIDSELQSLVEIVAGARAEVEEAAHELRRYLDQLEFEPKELEKVQARLELIRSLRHKYGESVAEILAFRREAAAEIERLENAEERALEHEAQRAKVLTDMGTAAQFLTQHRHETARRLADRLCEELRELGFAEADFHIRIEQVEDAAGLPYDGQRVAFDTWGVDQVRFEFSANPGEPARSLRKVISGGEMSRVMLAIKAVLAEVDQLPTLIFDEIDAGVGGRTGRTVAQKMARIAGRRQVLCVSHLASIAAAADRHFLIEKEPLGGRTVTRVREVREAERVAELARMLGGDGPQAEEHARALANEAAGWRD